MDKKVSKYFKKYQKFSKQQLLSESQKLNQAINACHEYINAACNSFMGPLGALAVIKDNTARINAINLLLKSKDNSSLE